MRNAKPSRPLLILIVLVAFCLRIHQLDNFSFWIDEGLTPVRSGYSIGEILSNRITIQDGVTQDTHPPLYYLLIHFARSLLGESDFSYRFPSVLAGVLLVPLLFQLARRLDDSRVALLAAFLAAINPLQIWYSQEARMYSVLVLLAAAGSFVLYRAFTGSQPLRHLALYTLFAGLAFYTHYTAIFLIAAQGLVWTWLLWRTRQSRLLTTLAGLALLVILPLIPVALPRLFAGPEASYFPVSPLIMMQDLVHGFGLGLTVDLAPLGTKLLDLGAILLLVAGLIGPGWPRVSLKRGGNPHHVWLNRSFLLTYLLAAVFGLMLASLIKPSYMGVRHIIVGSPAYLLLVARGLFSLPRRPLLLAPAVALAVLVTGPAVSLRNLYGDPTYAKDDVRALIGYVERNAGGGDLLLYNNAIHLPLDWHYRQRQDLSSTALPVYPHPAGPGTESQLDELADQFARFWFIGDLPADGRDDGAIVRHWVESNLVAVNDYSAHGRNMEAKVVAYSTSPVVVSHLPEHGHPLELRWEGLPALRGLSTDFKQPAALPALWLSLLWEGGDPPAANRELSFALRGPDGRTWLDSNQPFWPYQMPPWPDEGYVRLSYHLPVLAGTPPGTYELQLLAWDGSSGEALGDWQQLASIELSSTGDWPLAPDWPFTGAHAIRFDNGLQLLGLSDAEPEIRPGHALPLFAYWQGEPPPADLRYRLRVVGPGGTILHTQEEAPGASWLDGSSWPTDAVIAQQVGLYFPPKAAPGRYRLRWQLLSGGAIVPGRPVWRPWATESIVLGQVLVRPWPLETEMPAEASPVQVGFGPAIQLAGFDLIEEPLRPGGSLEVTLYWLALAVPDRSYFTFVHLVSAQTGETVSQRDRIPANWLRPTDGWRSGEVVTDIYHLPVPEDLTPGAYNLYVGLYDRESWQRLPVTYQGEAQPSDQWLLATVASP